MKRKVMILALTFLLFLPAMGFTGDVEIGDIRVKWGEKGISGYRFWAEIELLNNSTTNYTVAGFFTFYDKDGFPIKAQPFVANVKAQGRGIGIAKHWLPTDQINRIADWDAKIDLESPVRR